MIGQIISHYKILEKLGEGGMGVVYKAQDTKLKRIVALKFLPHHVNATSEEQARFLQEAQAAATLNHPNVCIIYDIKEEQQQQFIVMEYVDGVTLRKKLAGGPLKIEDAIGYALQAGDALLEAHGKEIVHRDIKAENIMVNSKNQIKVMDFGLAKLKGSLKLTKTSSTVGTLAYMAPEQIQGGEVDARSDIFSFGVVVFEMLTGRLPFRGEHDAAMMYSILNEEPESIHQYLPDASPEIIHIMSKSLDKNPDDRYQSVSEMIVDLRRVKRDSTKVYRTTTPASAKPTASVSFPLHTSVRPKKTLFIGAGVTVLVIAALLFILQPWQTQKQHTGRKALAVLPFENQGDPEKEYFADGITDEITSRLSTLSGLDVIARSSAREYKKTTKSLKQIGEELGVDYILMGTVRWSGGKDQRVRVNPELIRVSNTLQTWSQPFEATFSDAFAIQANIAQQVAQVLDVKLLSPEITALEQKLTSNAEAYDYYLKGIEYDDRSSSRADREIAIEQFERAIALDPTFAAAYARLARVHAGMYWFYYDRTKERVAKSRIAAEKALALAPNLPVSHESMGWYHYHTKLDYNSALKEFSVAIELQPNNPNVSYGMAAVFRRQGNMSESVKHWRKAVEGSPRASEIVRQLGETLTLDRKYEEADEHYRNAIRLSPDNATTYGQRALNFLLWKGDLRSAAEAVEKGIQYGRAESSEDRLLFYMESRIALVNEDYEAAKRAIERMGTTFGLDNQFVYYPQSFLLAQVEGLRGSSAQARMLYQSSLETIRQRLKEYPDDERAHSAMGIAYAGLGRFAEAVREGERGRDLLPVEKEAWRGSYRLIHLAQIYTMTGDHDKAIDVLERLLVLPSDLSARWISIDPQWKPLRNNKRFQALVDSQ